MFKTTTSGKRPIKGPCEVRLIGLDGLRTLNLDGVDGCPGLLGASGTHLFMFIMLGYIIGVGVGAARETKCSNLTLDGVSE
jgi:hypothetical protein